MSQTEPSLLTHRTVPTDSVPADSQNCPTDSNYYEEAMEFGSYEMG